MSDTHVWMLAAAIDQALALLEEYRLSKWALVHSLDRDDPARPVWVTVWDELGELHHVVQDVLAVPIEQAPAETPLRRVGEHTREGLKRLDANRGHGWSQ